MRARNWLFTSVAAAACTLHSHSLQSNRILRSAVSQKCSWSWCCGVIKRIAIVLCIFSMLNLLSMQQMHSARCSCKHCTLHAAIMLGCRSHRCTQEAACARGDVVAEAYQRAYTPLGMLMCNKEQPGCKYAGFSSGSQLLHVSNQQTRWRIIYLRSFLLRCQLSLLVVHKITDV